MSEVDTDTCCSNMSSIDFLYTVNKVAQRHWRILESIARSRPATLMVRKPYGPCPGCLRRGDRSVMMSCNRMCDIEYWGCMLEDDTLSTFKTNKNAHSYHSHIAEETRWSGYRAARWNWPAENLRSNHSIECRTEGEFEHRALRRTSRATWSELSSLFPVQKGNSEGKKWWFFSFTIDWKLCKHLEKYER